MKTFESSYVKGLGRFKVGDKIKVSPHGEIATVAKISSPDIKNFRKLVTLDTGRDIYPHSIKEILRIKTYEIQYWKETVDGADYFLVEIPAYTNEEALEKAKLKVKRGKLFKILNFK